MPAPPAGAGRACDTSLNSSRGLAPGLLCLLAAGLGVLAAALPGDAALAACATLACAWLVFTMHVAAASLHSLLHLSGDADAAPCDDLATLFACAHGACAAGDGFPPQARCTGPARDLPNLSVHRSAGGLPLRLQPGRTMHGSSPRRGS